MKIATWNVNSIRSRLNLVCEWLRTSNPDIVLLQEIKCETGAFPYMEIEELGYNIAANGQKTFNGVAILSKFPIEDVVKKLPYDEEDIQARYIEAVISADRIVRVGSVYVPNGGAIESDKWHYKLKFLDRLNRHIKQLMEYDEIMVLGGDYNVAPEPCDVFDPKSLEGTTCYDPREREKFNAILNLGITDCFRALHPNRHQFSWWDYRAGSWQYNKGMRIDHLLLSPEAADVVKVCDIDDKERGKEKASDHVPVYCELKV